jgi:serine phosphatase RsbU (regulator of sigma subunit)
MKKTILFLFFYLVISCLAFAQINQTSNMLTEKHFVFEDKTGNLTIDAIQDSAYQIKFVHTEKNILQFKLSQNWFWIKMEVETPQPTDDLLLEIAEGLLEFVDFYYQDKNGQWQVMHGGYSVPIAQKYKKHYFQIFPLLSLQHQNKATFYLRTKGNAQVVPLKIFTQESFETKYNYRNLIYGLFYGIMLFIFLNNLVFGLLIRQFNYILYSAIVFCYALDSALLSGYLQWFFVYDNPATIFYIDTLLTISLVALYAKRYLNVKTSYWAGKFIIGLIIFNSLALLCIFWVPNFWKFITIQAISLFNIISILVITISSLKREKLFAWYYLIALVVFLSFIICQLIYVNTGNLSYQYVSYLEWGWLAELLVLAFSLNRKFEFEKLQLETENRKAQAENLRLVKEQNEVLEQKVTARTEEIAKQNQELLVKEEEIRMNFEELAATQEQLQMQFKALTTKSKSISDSITYAQRIQNALLPRLVDIRAIFPESFVFFRPRDVISGDFYWFANKADENLQIIVAADCTGHGVPGAFMSMLGSSLLSNIIHDKEIHLPHKILDFLHEGVEVMLNQRQENSENRDGMDATICVIDRKNKQIHFAGANNSLYVISQNALNFVNGGTEKQMAVTTHQNWQLTELKADKKPIGGRVGTKYALYYTLQTFALDQECRIYLSSDGFIDQIGGEQRRKLMAKNFKQLLIENHQIPYTEQEMFFSNFFNNWIGNEEKQLDDIMVLGIKVT